MTELSETTPQPPLEVPRNTWKRFLLDILETVGLAVVLFLTINAISVRVRVDGYSMLPTLDNNQYVLVNRLAYAVGDFKRGDIIVFRPPMYAPENLLRRLIGLPGLEEDYIKRIIGLPGDTVKIENGSVKINDIPLKESYITALMQYSGQWDVQEGYLFVLGDNRNNSNDSHQWGLLPVDNVLGRAVLIYWPLPDWMVLKPNQAVLAAP